LRQSIWARGVNLSSCGFLVNLLTVEKIILSSLLSPKLHLS
jgi:hypothetical protein